MTDTTDPGLSLSINNEAGNWPEDDALIRTSIEAALATVELPTSVCVSLLLTDDAHQLALNLKWRGIDKPTNVLSFPSGEDMPIPGEPLFLGDISLAYETVMSEAKNLEKTMDDHLCHLMVHGTLHLLGFDHETDDDANEMESLEIEVLKSLGLSNPYEDRI